LDGLSNPIPLFKLQNIACDYRDFIYASAHHAISEGKLERCVLFGFAGKKTTTTDP
jgi:hypothetical protein